MLFTAVRGYKEVLSLTLILFTSSVGKQVLLLLCFLTMNTVRNLQIRPFHRLSVEEKLEAKRLGPDRPDLSSFMTKSISIHCFTTRLYIASRYFSNSGLPPHFTITFLI